MTASPPMLAPLASPSLLRPIRYGASRYRHIVFVETAGRHRPALNLTPIVTAPPAPKRELPISQEDESLLRWLFSQGGLDLRHYRLETLRRRIPSCLRALGVTSAYQARVLLQQNPHRIPAALSALVIGVTSFFRDPAVFDLLGQQVLPRLMEGRFKLRIWSIGCSDGSELYSMAILLEEMGWLGRCHLLGTDCRPDAIGRAREGYYEHSALKGLSPQRIGRHFVYEQARWRVAPALRAAVQWRCGNVLQIQEPGCWDMILCRNMVMYLRPESADGLWDCFERSLRPGGALVLGKAERPMGSRRLLSLEGSCIYRRDRG